ncbi:MAG TPA: substrate-binding domain-containing protein [Clostridiaceae bacterium]|nr:substrate-binding domain-containing protein [Clostridiaceae bacterium]
MKKLKMISALMLVAVMLLTVAGCKGKDSKSDKDSDEKVEEKTDAEKDADKEEITEKAKEEETDKSDKSDQGDEPEILSVSANNEKAVSATTLSLTDEELEKLKEGNYTAAIAMHYGGNDWATSQLQGLTDTFEKMGIEIVATTDADLSPEKQVSDLETIMASKPDILVSLPTEPTSTANAYQRVADAGTKIVFMDNIPEGFIAGENYVSCVSADNYGNGIIAADLIGEALNGEGKIGVVFFDVNFFVTNQRLEAFEKTMAEKYPNIEIVSKQGFVDEGGCDVIADAMMTQYPEIQAIFAHWDIPAEGVLSALNAIERDDVLISTIDLGNNIAKQIASGRVLGVGAQLPYDQGVAEATCAAYALLGKEVPPYVAVPATRVDQSNIIEGYEKVYHMEAPDWLTAELEK